MLLVTDHNDVAADPDAIAACWGADPAPGEVLSRIIQTIWLFESLGPNNGIQYLYSLNSQFPTSISGNFSRTKYLWYSVKFYYSRQHCPWGTLSGRVALPCHPLRVRALSVGEVDDGDEAEAQLPLLPRDIDPQLPHGHQMWWQHTQEADQCGVRTHGLDQ